MAKKYLTKPNIKEIVVKFENLSDITSKSLNCKFGKNVSGVEKRECVCEFGYLIEKMYNVNGYIYAYTQRDQLFQFDPKTNQFTTLMTACGGVPIVLEITFGGQKKILIINQSSGVVDGNVFYMPYGDYALTHNGRCFVANKKTVNFGGPFDFSDFSFRVHEGTFTVDDQSGEIVGLATLGSKLYIICQRAIYELIESDVSIFKLVKLKLNIQKAEHHSVKSLGDKVFFVSRDKVCSFDGNKIQILKDIGDYGFSYGGDSSAINGKYAILVAFDSQPCHYVYDAVNDCEEIVSLCGHVTADHGYVVDYNGKLFQLTDFGGQVFNEVYWQSKEIDFGTTKNKNLLEICLTTSGCKQLVVSGDFGSRTFNLQDGVCKFNLNCASRRFKFYVTAHKDFSISQLIAKYTIIGGANAI